MNVYVDGGCRGNGQAWAYGAAAACFKQRSGDWLTWTRRLNNNSYPPPTNQRAEITAVIVALQQILDKYEELNCYPRLQVTIYTDSKYVVGCMADWIYKWSSNGWINAAGNEVVNRDLIQEASCLDDRVAELGTIKYQWIPRAQNEMADGECNDEMNEMANESDDNMSDGW